MTNDNLSSHRLENITESSNEELNLNRTKKYTRYHYNIRPKQTFTHSIKEDNPVESNVKKTSGQYVDVDNNPEDEFYDRVGTDFADEDVNYEDLNVSEANSVSSVEIVDTTKKPEYDYLYYYYYDYVYPEDEKQQSNQLESLPKPSFLVGQDESELGDLESSTTFSTDTITIEASS